MHVGGYHEYRGGVQYRGGKSFGTSLMVVKISPHMYHESPRYCTHVIEGDDSKILKVRK